MRRKDYEGPGPVWRYRLLTEVLGPVGRSWGFSLMSHRTIDGICTVHAVAWWIDATTKMRRETACHAGTADMVDSDSMSLATDRAVNFALCEIEKVLPYRLIPLSKGYAALVNADDHDPISRKLWSVSLHRGSRYAVRGEKIDGKNCMITMHREIMNPEDDRQVDHCNHDGIDNRRRNLRVCSNKQNSHNTRARNGSSTYKGVCFYKARNKWTAQITFNGKIKHLGYFSDEIEAAKAYDAEAKILFGDFAHTNF